MDSTPSQRCTQWREASHLLLASEGTARSVDRSVQLCGGLGTTEEPAVGRIYADTRAFRIYDGASEVHRMPIARRVARRACAELASARA